MRRRLVFAPQARLCAAGASIIPFKREDTRAANEKNADAPQACLCAAGASVHRRFLEKQTKKCGDTRTVAHQTRKKTLMGLFVP